MPVKTIKNYIDGEWLASRSSNLADVHNPATGEVIAQVPMSTVAEANQAVAAAREHEHQRLALVDLDEE